MCRELFQLIVSSSKFQQVIVWNWYNQLNHLNQFSSSINWLWHTDTLTVLRRIMNKIPFIFIWFLKNSTELLKSKSFIFHREVSNVIVSTFFLWVFIKRQISRKYPIGKNIVNENENKNKNKNSKIFTRRVNFWVENLSRTYSLLLKYWKRQFWVQCLEIGMSVKFCQIFSSRQIGVLLRSAHIITVCFMAALVLNIGIVQCFESIGLGELV